MAPVAYNTRIIRVRIIRYTRGLYAYKPNTDQFCPKRLFLRRHARKSTLSKLLSVFFPAQKPCIESASLSWVERNRISWDLPSKKQFFGILVIRGGTGGLRPRAFPNFPRARFCKIDEFSTGFLRTNSSNLQTY